MVKYSQLNVNIVAIHFNVNLGCLSNIHLKTNGSDIMNKTRGVNKTLGVSSDTMNKTRGVCNNIVSWNLQFVQPRRIQECNGFSLQSNT